jgi:hypothetical protein
MKVICGRTPSYQGASPIFVAAQSIRRVAIGLPAASAWTELITGERHLRLIREYDQVA